ncbi:MAG: cytochrome c3 family protein [Blastopirellula sp. JB062]
MDRFLFPRWVNRLVPLAGAGFVALAVYSGVVFVFATAPETISVGHAPIQPVPFSHRLHAGKLKMDCRYCHNTVDEAAQAAVPPTATCGNCHSPAGADGSSKYAAVLASSPNLEPVHESLATGESVDWQRVHDLPDFVYFDHSAHVTRGVSCVSCHGRVDTMDVVTQVEPLSMAFCLDCHRNPDPHIRPQDEVTNLAWQAPGSETDPHAAALLGAEIRKENGINPSTNCSTCHR